MGIQLIVSVKNTVLDVIDEEHATRLNRRRMRTLPVRLLDSSESDASEEETTDVSSQASLATASAAAAAAALSTAARIPVQRELVIQMADVAASESACAAVIHCVARAAEAPPGSVVLLVGPACGEELAYGLEEPARAKAAPGSSAAFRTKRCRRAEVVAPRRKRKPSSTTYSLHSMLPAAAAIQAR